MAPVDALTIPMKPDLVVPKRITQTGAGKRESAPNETDTGFSALSFTFSQSAAFSAAVLYAASESP